MSNDPTRFSSSMEPDCTSAKALRRRPHPSLLRMISRKGTHPGRAHRIKRWHRYQVGMSLLHCRETAGLDHLDVLYYERQGLMTLRPMTVEERRDALSPWDEDASTGTGPQREGRTPPATPELDLATPARDRSSTRLQDRHARARPPALARPISRGANHSTASTSAEVLQIAGVPICRVCGGSGKVQYEPLFGRPRQTTCGSCKGRGDLREFYAFDAEEYRHWRGVYERERSRGPPRQPRHLRHRAGVQRRSLPILFRLLASVVRAISRGTRN